MADSPDFYKGFHYIFYKLQHREFVHYPELIQAEAIKDFQIILERISGLHFVASKQILELELRKFEDDLKNQIESQNKWGRELTAFSYSLVQWIKNDRPFITLDPFLYEKDLNKYDLLEADYQVQILIENKEQHLYDIFKKIDYLKSLFPRNLPDIYKQIYESGFWFVEEKMNGYTDGFLETARVAFKDHYDIKTVDAHEFMKELYAAKWKQYYPLQLSEATINELIQKCNKELSLLNRLIAPAEEQIATQYNEEFSYNNAVVDIGKMKSKKQISILKTFDHENKLKWNANPEDVHCFLQDLAALDYIQIDNWDAVKEIHILGNGGDTISPEQRILWKTKLGTIFHLQDLLLDNKIWPQSLKCHDTLMQNFIFYTESSKNLDKLRKNLHTTKSKTKIHGAVADSAKIIEKAIKKHLIAN